MMLQKKAELARAMEATFQAELAELDHEDRQSRQAKSVDSEMEEQATRLRLAGLGECNPHGYAPAASGLQRPATPPLQQHVEQSVSQPSQHQNPNINIVSRPNLVSHPDGAPDSTAINHQSEQAPLPPLFGFGNASPSRLPDWHILRPFRRQQPSMFSELISKAASRPESLHMSDSWAPSEPSVRARSSPPTIDVPWSSPSLAEHSS